MFKTRDVGIDLGTTIVRICTDRGIVLREPSVVALIKETGEVKAVGEDAYRLLGKAPGSVVMVRPLRDGVIADYPLTEKMLGATLRRATAGPGRLLGHNVMLTVPGGVSPNDQRTILQAVREGGAKYARLIEAPLAAALGAGLDVTEPTGKLIVDVGGGTTDVAVVSLGGVVVAESLRIAGSEFDEAIVRFVRHKENTLIGDRTAEEIKLRVGAASLESSSEGGSFEVRGRDITSSLPRDIVVTTHDVVEALRDSLEKILAGVQRVLETAPPELTSDVIDRGIVMTGGGALLPRFSDMLAASTGISVRVAENAADCTALGIGKAFAVADALEPASEISER